MMASSKPTWELVVNANSDGSITLSQARMLDRLLAIVGLDYNASNVKLQDCLALSVLYGHPASEPIHQSFNYCSAVGFCRIFRSSRYYSFCAMVRSVLQ